MATQPFMAGTVVETITTIVLKNWPQKGVLSKDNIIMKYLATSTQTATSQHEVCDQWTTATDHIIMDL